LNNFLENLHSYRDRNKVYKEIMQKKYKAVDSKFKTEISPLLIKEENTLNTNSNVSPNKNSK